MSECQNTSLKSTGLCSCLWMDCESQLQLQQQYRITEFGRSAEFPRIPWNSAETWKFRGNGQIPRLGSKFRGPRKTVVPNDKLVCSCVTHDEWCFCASCQWWWWVFPRVRRGLACELVKVTFRGQWHTSSRDERSVRGHDLHLDLVNTAQPHPLPDLGDSLSTSVDVVLFSSQIQHVLPPDSVWIILCVCEFVSLGVCVYVSVSVCLCFCQSPCFSLCLSVCVSLS